MDINLNDRIYVTNPKAMEHVHIKNVRLIQDYVSHNPVQKCSINARLCVS